VPLLAVALVAAVASPAAAGPQERFHPARDVSIRRIAGSVFLHTSRDGELSTNGLIVGAREGTLLVNTAPTAAQTEALLRWVTETQPRPVRLAILTAPDAARMGGLQALVEARIPIHASWRTERRARERQLGWTPDHFGFESEAHISAGDHTLHLFQPEELPPDILAVWVPEEGVLYAGELILPADPRGVPLERGLARARARALSRVRGRFPDPVWVVPATGEPGDRGLVERALRDLRRLR
jgi:glyoxylase-like metal-dependent hydrolase (beta-lactamase superfamily II)